MRRAEPKWERGASQDLWRHTLSQISTVFGRLVYLSSLRDQNTGLYEHHGLAQIFGETEAHTTLLQSHLELFGEWLCFGLERQKSDVGEYLSNLSNNIGRVLATWTRLRPYRNIPPACARDVERQLFMADLEAVLELLRHDYAVAAPDPDS